MASYADLTIVGNIGDVELKKSAKETPYLRMTVAVNELDGDPCTWYACIITGKAAENPQKFMAAFRKGRLVLVNGRPRPRAYSKHDGTAAMNNVVLVDRMPQLLDHD